VSDGTRKKSKDLLQRKQKRQGEKKQDAISEHKVRSGASLVEVPEARREG
jgi:hypothetical protein